MRGSSVPQVLHVVLDGGGVVCHSAAATDGDHAYCKTLLRLPVNVALDVVSIANRTEDDHLGRLTH